MQMIAKLQGGKKAVGILRTLMASACRDNPVTVMNLSTGDEQVFVGMDVAAAVFAAYQQDKGNWETWTYANLYTEQHHLMNHGKRTVAMGDFAAVKTEQA